MTEPIVLRLRSTDEAKRSFRRGALRYAAGKCRIWGFLSAADELERYADHIGEPEDTEVTEVPIFVDVPDALDNFDDSDSTRHGRLFRTSSLNRVFEKICE